MSTKKPIPLSTTLPRGLCPVCGKASYSLAGTHPQCASARAGAVARTAPKAGSQLPKPPERKSWQKTCPKCNRRIQARRIVCDCGHSFGSKTTGQMPSVPSGETASR
jgi:hypothetical protein